MARSAVEDPLKVFRFRVVVDDFFRAGFQECSELDQQTADVAYGEGGGNETEQKSAGLSKFKDLVLERGQLIGSSQGGDLDFLTWAGQVYQNAVLGNATNYRKDINIQQYSATNTLAVVWTVYETWPKGYTPFSALKFASENSKEKLTLVNEGFARTGP